MADQAITVMPDAGTVLMTDVFPLVRPGAPIGEKNLSTTGAGIVSLVVSEGGGGGDELPQTVPGGLIGNPTATDPEDSVATTFTALFNRAFLSVTSPSPYGDITATESFVKWDANAAVAYMGVAEPIVAVSGDKTLSVSDVDTWQECDTSGAAMEITVDVAGSFPAAIGTSIRFRQNGANPITFVGDGFSIVTKTGFDPATSGADAIAELKKLGSPNSWFLFGDLEPS